MLRTTLTHQCIAGTARATALLPAEGTAVAGARRAAAAAQGSVPTGPTGGYNDPDERSIAEESEEQLAQERKAAQAVVKQGGRVEELSGAELASALAGESREAAAEHAEDAGDASKVEGDTLTDRSVLEGKSGTGVSYSA